MNGHLLEVSRLVTSFRTEDGVVRAVNDISFHIDEGETFGLVGESGCGKSVTSLSIMRLLQTPPAKYEQGKVLFRGKDLLALPEPEMRKIRGNDISMIFQEPMSSLNPVFTVGFQIVEALRLHRGMTKVEARREAVRLLDVVSIPDPGSRVDNYPHQMSGGMRQRVMIAMALACSPKLLIADEPTTALDVTVQAQILELLKALQDSMKLGLLLITHDLGVVAEVCRRVAIMYAGKLVETGTVFEIFEDPKHPYTQGLLTSIPRVDKVSRKEPLKTIPGMVPRLSEMPKGCAFADRCSHCMPVCREHMPQGIETSEGHWVRCYLHEPAPVGA